MADNQEELKELFETGVTQRQIDAAKQKAAALAPSENKAKGIELKLGPSSRSKPTDLNPVAKKKGGKVKAKCKCMSSGGKVSSASKRADGCATKGKTKGRLI